MQNKDLKKPITVEEFLAQGGIIEKLEPVTEYKPSTYGSAASAIATPDLLTLGEADDLFGEDRSRNKTDTDEGIVNLLAKVVKRNPNFLEQHKIPSKFVEQLPDELRSAAKIKPKNTRRKIDTSMIDGDFIEILRRTNPQALKDMGLDEESNNDTTGTGSTTPPDDE